MAELLSGNHMIEKRSAITTQIVITGIIFLLICIGLSTSSACGAETTNTTSDVDFIEIYHFHPTNGCPTCTAIGNYAEDTVNQYFPEELENKKILFAHINFQDQKNEELVKRFEVTGSSLMIGVHNATGFHKEEDIKVWYKAGNKDEFISYLKSLIERRLTGSLE